MSRVLNVSIGEAGQRLDVFLSTAFEDKNEKNKNSGDITRSQIRNHIDAGKVLIDGRTPLKAGEKLKAGAKISVQDFELEVSPLAPQNLPVEIIYEDDSIIVVNKAQGMVVHPGSGNKSGTLINALLFSSSPGGGEKFRPGIVHRIDKDTSGLLVVAKTAHAHDSLSRQIGNRTAKREYVAICHGTFKNADGIIKTNIARHPKVKTKMAAVCPPLGKPAITNYRVLKQGSRFAYVGFTLETGRTHQIRVHASYIGHPVVADAIYGSGMTVKGARGQLLHAWRLTLCHPQTNKTIVFEAPLPDYFKEFLTRNI